MDLFKLQDKEIDNNKKIILEETKKDTNNEENEVNEDGPGGAVGNENRVGQEAEPGAGW